MPGTSKSKRLPVLYLICILCVLVLPVHAGGTGITDLGCLINPSTENPGYSSPALSGDFVLFAAENSFPGSPDLFCYQVSTGELTMICSSGDGFEYWSTYCIGDRWVVYTKPHRPESRDIPAGSDIYAYNLESGKKEFSATSSGTYPEVSVYDNLVVWENGTNDRVWPGLSNTREYFVTYNLSEHTSADIVPHIPDNPEKPVIFKDLLVYSGVSYDPGNGTPGRGTVTSDIYTYNLSSGKEMQVSFSGKAYSPSVSGPLIVWEDTRNGNVDIYLYNLSGSEELPLCTDPADQRNPKISGDLVVWEDKRHQPAGPPVTACPPGQYCPVETPMPPVSDIYLYNITKKTETCISSPMGESYQASGDNCDPDVSGHRVVWTRNGDLFLYSDMNETTQSRVTGPQPGHAAPGNSPPTTRPAGGWEWLMTAFALFITIITITTCRRR